ncbi:DUF2637 domain-containing protein [Kitasatospora sp. NPDC048239]|uniref:DUF2637 domain-containing protein n=1 Tax=Kitasatospora sp. NPDC048239 TaxID=3364046 RepID=UPI0037213965
MARPSLTKAHRGLLGLVAAGAFLISGIGFAGSYNAVRDLAVEKGFGAFSYAFPIGVDAGIVVLLALDLVLTWLRIPFPLLRQTAWLLTVATIAFNAAASWGDPLGMGMHAVIPVLFVVVVEASRHAVGRIAAITADRHMESVRMMRWLLSPVPTFRLWRRMKLWELRSYDEVVRLEQNRLVYRAQLRFRYGRGWRRSAPIQALLPLKLAKYGVPLDPAVLDRLDEAEASRAAAELRKADAAAVAIAPTAGEAAAAAPRPAVAQPASAQPGPAQPVAVQAASAQSAPAQSVPVPFAPVQPEPAQPAPAAVAPDVAVPMLAKLAAVRRRAEHEPAGAAEQAPPALHEELNVWTERPVRTVGQQDDGAAGRVSGQASPWFKPPRVTTAPPAPVAAATAAAASAPAAAQAPLPVPPSREEPYADQAAESDRPEEPADQGAADVPEAPARARLDADLCFEALVSYIDTFDHQPDPQRLAAWLTKEYGMAGTLSDGSVNPKDVAELFPELRDRYVSAGRD